jgi:hypothetical protein
MMYEVRNYHFQPGLLSDYKAWAKDHAVPYLSRRLEVVDFWVDGEDPPEVNGEPLDALGSANVTWVIRWRDLAHRNQDLPAALGGPEWEAIFSQVPGGRASYLRVEAKFMQSLL